MKKNIFIICLVVLLNNCNAMQCIDNGFTEKQCSRIKEGKQLINQKWEELNNESTNTQYINQQMYIYKYDFTYLEDKTDVLVLEYLASYIDILRLSLNKN